MLKTPCHFIILIVLVTNSANAFCQIDSENKDSLMTALVEKLKLSAGANLITENDSVVSQVYSYMGYVLRGDSVVTSRLLTVETRYINDTIDRKLVVFDENKPIGFFQIHHTIPYKIQNYKYLSFDKTVKDFNGHPVHIKINLSEGIPQHFLLDDDEFNFNRFEPQQSAAFLESK